MSDQIPVAFEQKFANDFIMLAQQKASRTINTVRDDGVSGAKYYHFDRIGATGMVRKTSRHMDTPVVNTPHSRRRVGIESYVWADLIDRADLQRMMKSPQNSYMSSGVSAAGRQIDDIVLAAARGNAVSVDQDDAASNIALPSAQKVAAASAGLTLAKILATKEILDAAEVPDEDRYFFYSAKQGTNLLNTTQVTSADYNSVKALVNGQLNAFLGFTWIRTERLAKVSTTRYCLAWQKNAMGIYRPTATYSRVTERPDKNFSVQVYAEVDCGAVRIEDAGVVEVACIES